MIDSLPQSHKEINNEGDKKVRYAWLKFLGIVGLGVVGVVAVGAGVGLALGAFGISMGIPLVGSALVTAGSWLATAIPALGAFGVALPIAIGAIVGLGIAALAIFGIYKLIKSFGNEGYEERPPKEINRQAKELSGLVEIINNLELNKNNKGEKNKNSKGEKNKNKTTIGKKSKDKPKEIKRKTLKNVENGNDSSSDSISINGLGGQFDGNKIKIIDMKPIDNNKNKIELGKVDNNKLEKEKEEIKENKKEPEIIIKEEDIMINKEKPKKEENNIEGPDKKPEEINLKEETIINQVNPKEDEKPKEEENQEEIK